MWRQLTMIMMTMVMVMGFAYKIGKSERSRLVDESSRKRFGEGPKGLRKIGGRLVFDSMAFVFFSFLIFSSLTR